MTVSMPSISRTITPRANLISVIIRAHNEALWLASCLNAVQGQDYPAIEIIVVDNESTDGTLAIAETYGATVLTISREAFNYSRAINMGIAVASGQFIAILSAHCIPTDDRWLSHLAMHFRDTSVAATYGRQEPLPDSTPFDKRDLWITFGLDRKVQHKDFFFHNANSMIRRSIWSSIPFNENIHGVEDQDWARKVLRRGDKIVYEPLASVFHHHGIHHARSESRAQRVVDMIELIKQDRT